MLSRAIAAMALVLSFLVLPTGAARPDSPRLSRAPSPEESPKNLLARLSYDSTYAEEERRQQHFSRICFEIYRNGRYRISRIARGGPENLGGTLSQDRVNHLARLLKKVDFDSKGGGIVRQGSETFVAEVVRGGQTTRYIWVDPDHHRPFPDSAASVIGWLQGFRAQGASALTAPEVSTMQICPRMSDNPMQPVAAGRAEAGVECAPAGGSGLHRASEQSDDQASCNLNRRIDRIVCHRMVATLIDRTRKGLAEEQKHASPGTDRRLAGGGGLGL